MVIEFSPFQQGIGNILAHLLDFFMKTNPNPFVAIAAIDTYRNQLYIENIFNISINKTTIYDSEVEEFLALLKKFVENELIDKLRQEGFIPMKISIVTALEIAKYNFIAETI